MPDEPEMIRQQMEATRTSLTEKLETLEQQVAETVTAASDTVAGVKEAVQETVATVKDSVQETVESVKSSLDLPSHVEQHPWLSLGGAFLAGYVGGCLLEQGGSSRSSRTGRAAGMASLAQPANGPAADAWQARTSRETREREPARTAEKSWLDTLAQSFGPEIDKLKALAIGTALGLLRDSLVRQTPDSLRPRVTEVMDTFTAKLGGETIHGPILENSFQDLLARRQTTMVP